MLGWMHNFLQVDQLHWRMKVSGVVPRKREHSLAVWTVRDEELKMLACICGYDYAQN